MVKHDIGANQIVTRNQSGDTLKIVCLELILIRRRTQKQAMIKATVLENFKLVLSAVRITKDPETICDQFLKKNAGTSLREF